MQALHEDAAITSSTALASEVSIKAEIRDLTKHAIQLWSNHAIIEHSRMLTQDADLVNVVGMHLHGRLAIQASHEHLHRTVFAQAVLRILDLKIKVLHDTVVLTHIHWEMRGAAKLPGWNVPDPRTGFMTMIWIKQEGQWKITSMHNTDTITVPELPKA